MSEPVGRTARGGRALALGAFLAMSLVAASCGGDDGEPAGGGVGLDENIRSGVAEQLDDTEATRQQLGDEPQTPDELRARWEEERKAGVERITSNGWGVDENKVWHGPAGMTVDLNECPSNWSDTEGLTDTEIKLGVSIAQSGPIADYGNMLVGWQTYIDEINEAGGITDSEGKTRKIRVVARDDSYDPAKAVPLIDELLDSEKTFLIWNGSSPITLRIYDKINDRCVPQPLVWTGHPAWGDPVNHPWTMGGLLSYFTEAILWGSYIERTLPKGAKVAALAMNNDFGASYVAGFQAFLEQSQHEIQFEYELFEPTASTLTNEMTTLASRDPDVFIMMSTGATCAQAITEAASNGLRDSAEQLWQPSTCKALSFVGEDAVGDASDGWLIVGGGLIDINDQSKQEHPGVELALDLLESNGIDPGRSSNLGAGFSLGVPIVELLKIAGDLPGGLTRSNYLLAMRSMDMTNPLLLPGLPMKTNGLDDAYPFEGSEIARFDSGAQAWVQEGEVIDLDGESALCAWDQTARRCA